MRHVRRGARLGALTGSWIGGRKRRSLVVLLVALCVSLGVGALGAFAAGSGPSGRPHLLRWDVAAAPRAVRVSPGARLPGGVLVASARGQQFAASSGRDAVAAIAAVQAAMGRYFAARHAYSSCGNRGALHVSGAAARRLAAATVVLGTHATFQISVISVVGVRFTIERQPGGETFRSCEPAGLGGCDSQGTW
jgi:hypothetical protein